MERRPRIITRRQLFESLLAQGAAGWWVLQNPNARMIERAIPLSNERLPVIGMGTWQTFDVSGGSAMQQLQEVLQRFAMLGGRVIDSSPMYGKSESVVGTLCHRLNLHDRLFFATKCGRVAARREFGR